MIWQGNLHGHCYYCDGEGRPEEYVMRALELGHSFIGFSSHVPLTVHRSSWNMAPENFYGYLNEIQELKRKYEGKIHVFCAFEMDDPYSLYTCQDLRELYSDFVDYTVGSVHYLDTLPDGTLWEVDGATEKFMRGVEQLCNGSMRVALEKYFHRLTSMLRTSQPVVVGHIDKVVIHEPVKSFVKEHAGMYEDAMCRTLECISTLGLTMELNTRGLYTGRHDDIYPARRFWPYIKELQIPVVINSDCHRPEELEEVCRATFQQAVEAGLNVVSLPSGLNAGFSSQVGCR